MLSRKTDMAGNNNGNIMMNYDNANLLDERNLHQNGASTHVDNSEKNEAVVTNGYRYLLVDVDSQEDGNSSVSKNYKQNLTNGLLESSSQSVNISNYKTVKSSLNPNRFPSFSETDLSFTNDSDMSLNLLEKRSKSNVHHSNVLDKTHSCDGNKRIGQMDTNSTYANGNKSSVQTEKPEWYTEMCNWKSETTERNHNQFLSLLFDIVKHQAIFNGTNRENKVLEWISPEDLPNLIDLKLTSEPTTQGNLLNLLAKVIKYSVKTGHPYFINQLYSSLDPYGFAGELVADALNPSMYTYEVAPVFTLMEFEVLSMMAKYVGYEEHEGIFSPGGSISNLYALLLARHKMCPSIKDCGASSLPPLAAFTSEDSHYSVEKGANIIGLGAKNLYKIPVESNGAMNVSALSEAIDRATSAGQVPFFVAATAGTTVIGAFDNIMAIADICESRRIWLHVDAAWGGGALLSPKYKHLLGGIERADSVTWNPHKLVAAPQQCSVFLTKHVGLLTETNAANASYLFQKDKFYNTSYDTGDMNIQCGRKADVAKIWTMWKAKGSDGLQAHIEHIFSLSKFFHKTICDRPGFKVIAEPQCTNVCFWYIPPSLRDWNGDDTEFQKRLNGVAPKIKERMMKTGSMMISYQQLRAMPNFFRLVLQNSSLTSDDMIYFIETIESLGKDL